MLEALRLLTKLRSIWRNISQKNPITPAKIVMTLKLIYSFVTNNKLLCLLLLGLGVAASGAGQEPPRRPEAAPLPTCSVTILVGGDGSSGRGTIIRPDMVVTCNHLFTDSNRDIVVFLSTGAAVKGELFSRDKVHDLATVILARPVEAEYATVSSSQDLTDLSLFNGKKTTFHEWKRPSVQTAEAATLVSSGEVPSGYSGGGLYNAGGLYGVIWGSVDGETYATSGAKFRGFIDRTFRMRANALAIITDPFTCSTCAEMHPMLERLAGEGYFIIAFEPKDGERIPRLVFWRDNVIIKEIDGYANERTIRRFLEFPTYDSIPSPAGS